MVCLIHRPEYYKIFQGPNGEDLRGIAEIIIAKHRNGETGDVSLRFKGEFTRFSNLSEQSFGNGGGGILLESKSNNKPTSAPTITLPEENYSPF
jgi:replicative DNA helicase